MALDPKMLQSLPDALVDMYGLVEIDILEDMARRISTYDYFIPAAQHQLQKLQELGAVQSEIIAKLSAMTGKTQAKIVELLTEAGQQAIEDDIEYYTATEVYEPSKVNTEALYKQLNSGLLQTQQAFKNITGTTANTATKQFENALDRAWLQINTGGMDYNTAISRAIKDLAKGGIGAIQYKSGQVDSIEVAVRRAVVTGANQTAMKTQEVLADELDVELVEVTAHGGARPEHAKWQGKVFSRNGRVKIDGVVYEDLRKATGYGTGAGLGGWNCRHNFHPFIPGAPRTWSDKELAKLDEKNIEYNGVKMTEYEASQAQRKIEREIRKQKRTVAALEAAGEDASEYRSKLRAAQKSYTDFTAQTGLKKQQARTQTGAITDKDKAESDAIIAKRQKQAAAEAAKSAKNTTPQEVHIDITDGGKFERLPYSMKQEEDYKKAMRPEYYAQRMTHADNSVLWSSDIGYIQNSEGYRNINGYLRGTVPDTDYDHKYDDTIEVIDRRTSQPALKHDYVGYRKVDMGYLKDVLGIDVGETVSRTVKNSIGGNRATIVPANMSAAQNIAAEINKIVGTEEGTVHDKAYTSISLSEGINYFKHYPVQFEIQMPTGTRGLITDNWKESEFITQRNSAIEILGAEAYNDGEKDCIRIFGRLVQE